MALVNQILQFSGLFFLSAGLLFVVIGVLGLIRFHDFYSRTHAGGVIDTLGAEFMLLGLGLLFAAYSDWPGVIKIVLIGIFLLLTSPTSSHAIVNAAFTSGLKPRRRDGSEIAVEKRSTFGRRNDEPPYPNQGHSSTTQQSIKPDSATSGTEGGKE